MANSDQKYAICIDNTDYPASLELRKIYRVIADPDAMQDGDLRVVDESGEDYLYPADYFVIVDFPASAIRALRKSFAREASEAR
jgi:hypothetical protein